MVIGPKPPQPVSKVNTSMPNQAVVSYNQGATLLNVGAYIVSNTSLDTVSRKVESPDYTGQFLFDRSRFVPQVNFADPSNFAKFGSAEQYYVKAIENIYRYYPYDGSLKEKLQWHNASSFFDNYIFEYEYPRTNGYLEIGETWGSTSATETPADGDVYKLSDAPQYISVQGGPHAASTPTYATASYTKELNFKEAEQKANVYDATTRQIQNFTIDGVKGNTVEFWLKLPLEPSKSQTSPSHAYFDLWNGETIDTDGYGRFLIETRYDTDVSDNPTGEYINDTFFHVTYMSGTQGVLRAAIGAKELTSSLGLDLSEWNHIAFTVLNANVSNLEIKLYANGNLIETTLTGSTVNAVATGSFNSTIGAYKHAPGSDADTDGVTTGYGSLTGSFIDEFRFWTIHRDSDDINFNWFKQVAGGTNSDFGSQTSKYYEDINPVNLGVYYKFNEGITLTSSIDRVAIDYSGRVSNGFISNYTEAMRSTGSAIVEKGAASREFKDPIIYQFHPSVVTYQDDAKYKGREYDGRNSMYLYNMLPNWIIDEDQYKGRNQALYLNQIIASYFDNLFLQIQSVPALKDPTYISGSASGSMNKPLPFADRLLSNTGFTVPEIFANASVFEALANRDDEREFERKLADIKNEIYSNIYNNLLYINKAKGTVKSITNMMRCFGVDDDLYSINFYANNAELDLKGNFLPKTVRKSYADFNYYTRHNATIFQMTSSGNTNSVSFITGSQETYGWDSENGFTVESEVIFPKMPAYSDPSFKNYNFPHYSASLFGMHQALIDAGDTPGDTTWATVDFANFQVYAVKEKANNAEPESENVRFILTSSNPSIAHEGLISEMSSETFKKVYNNERWNLSVKLYPEKYPNIGMLSGSEETEYTVEFSGYNLVGDVVQNSFNIKQNITEASGLRIASKNKRIFAGAHRTNFTGSLLDSTNVKISSCRYWAIPLSNDELLSHALDPKNYGVYNTMRSSYLLQDRDSAYPVDIPKIKTLWMNWDFDTVTGSDTGAYDGEFSVVDFSSGSGDDRYGPYFSEGVEKQHTGRAIYFETGNNNTGSISREYVSAYRQQVPENLNNQDAVKVLTRDDEFFTRRTKPITFSFSVEKSMYQSISEEMLNFLAASQEASSIETLIGNPVNKYRGRYKQLEKLRNIFFERVGNTPDLDRYIEYFKWLDASISQMIQQVVPASSNFSTVRNMVESHVLERSGKYKHKFPTIENFYPKAEKVGDLNKQVQFNSVQKNEGVYDAVVSTAIADPRSADYTSLSNAQLPAGGQRISLSSWRNNSAPPLDGSSVTPDQTESLSWWANRAPFSAETGKISGDNAVNNASNDLFDVATIDSQNLIYDTSNRTVSSRSPAPAVAFSVDAGGDKSAFNDQNRSRPKKDLNFRDVVFKEAPAGSGNRISFNTNTLARQKNTNTLDSIDPNRKFKPEFDVSIPSKSTEKAFDGRKFAPISFQSSSTDNPDVTGSSPWYVGYELSTQHLQDYYLSNKDIPMQGPFTEQNVGGYAYRHGGIHIEPSQDGGFKPEAWYALRTITANPDGVRYDFYNPFDLPNGVNYPRALYTRDQVAKRPLNIRNIKSTTGSYLPQRTDIPPIDELGNIKTYIGNYEKDYQIVQISSRDNNNRYFVDNNGISTASIPSEGIPSVSGAYDWAVPDRGKNEHIFVSRFSAPGGPEVNGAAFLNYESEVYSPYNAMPFRNLSVRQPLRTLLTRHTAFGGYDSELGSPSASYNKTQRNARRYLKRSDIFGGTLTASVYDNYFIQHQIPQSDQQYSWISASAITYPFGFSQPDYGNNGYASTDIVFASSSDFGAYEISAGVFIFGTTRGAAEAAGDAFIPTDFVGLNTIAIPDSDSFDENTLFYDPNSSETFSPIINFPGTPLTNAGAAATLNGQLLNNNGPYGFSTWRQARMSYNRIVRYMRNINRFSILKEATSISPGDLKFQKITTQTLENFTEPMVSFKYKPLEYDLIVKGQNGAISVVEADSTYANELGTFANNKIDDLLGYEKDPKSSKLIYNTFKDVYLSDDIPQEAKPIQGFEKLAYREIVYPRERNTGLGKTRGRENYTVSSGSDNFNLKMGDSIAFWKNKTEDRLRSDAEARNAEGLIIASGSSYFGMTDMSVWPLDAEEPFYDLYQVSSSDSTDGGTDYNPYYWAPLSPSSALDGLDPTRTTRFDGVNKNGELSYAGWVYSLLGINIQGKVRADGAPTGSGPLPNFPLELNFKPTASFQFEYPNLMMSGAMEERLASPSASLHLMAPYRADVLSGKTPWFNSYEDYSEDIRRIAKDYTVLPEFRISDHIDYYLNEGFFADNNKFLDIIGASLENTASATNETGSFQADFFKVYSHSDFMKHFSVIQEDHKENNTAFASTLRLEANAVKKLLPYQGFYPALRSVQLGHLFSASYAPYLTGSNLRDGEQERLAALYQPFFAPGIFFNTVKSGIAVSYPVHTASAPEVDKATNLTAGAPTNGAYFVSNVYESTPNYLFPFEAILDPDQYLPVSSSLTSSVTNSLSSSVYFVYPNFTGSNPNTNFDAFYTKQTEDSPYTPLLRTSQTPVQPQLYFEWKGQSDPKYSLAASNFFAEAVDFFLEKGTLTSFISKPEKDFNSMVSGSTYYMDVLLYKTDNYVSYEGAPSGTFNYDGGAPLSGSVSESAWNSLVAGQGDGILNKGISARGMHYGPAYKASGLAYGSTGTGSVPYASFRAQDPTYAPHTPPYFYGTSRARIAFKPHMVRDMAEGEASKFTLEEILSNAKVETMYENDNQMAKTLQEDSYRNNYAAGIAQMQLSSSVNLFGQITLKEVEYGTEQNPDGTYKATKATTPVVQGTNDAWIIETKFECPSINMANMDTGSLGAGIGDGKEKYHTRGIWKGYGEYPTGSEGLFLQLKESYPQITNDYEAANGSELTGSLIDVCGFKASKERVGEIRAKKTISEAIVAVPIDEKGNFIPIDQAMFAKQKLNYETSNKALLAGDFGVESDIGETSITDMIEKMKKFSLPPQMDFLNNPNVDPFVMYIFDFTHSLDRKDLADIWQNLMPKISTTAEKQTKAIEHGVGVNYEFFGQFKQGNLPSNIRWMVFKAKQKARNNFFNVTQQSEVAKGFTFTALQELQGFSSNPEAELPYSYNWPYDYFSLVELAQIESEVTFEPPEE